MVLLFHINSWEIAFFLQSVFSSNTVKHQLSPFFHLWVLEEHKLETCF